MVRSILVRSAAAAVTAAMFAKNRAQMNESLRIGLSSQATIWVGSCNRINEWAFHHRETSQTRAVPSLLAETNVLPSAAQASDVTVPRCPSKRACSLPVAMSHRRIVGSQPAVANVRPFGDIAMDVIFRYVDTSYSSPAESFNMRWLPNCWRSFRVPMSNTWMVVG